MTRAPEGPDESVSDQLERWLTGDQPKTLDSLLEVFGPGSFGLLFVVLLAPAALPLPTGGATHVLEAIAMLVALQLIAGRRDVWLPERWNGRDLAGGRSERFVRGLVRQLRRVERFSRPRWRWLFRLPLCRRAFGLAVLGFTLAAFLAPPFSGLDTLPAIGVVLISIGMLTEDAFFALAGLVAGVVGIMAALFLGSLVINALHMLF
ncbi:MAG: exopolysaccharide biosynthesis protein [Solirubrobacteraceae bacterium]